MTMRPEDVEALLIQYKEELTALIGNGDGRDILAWTGERLAAAAESYRVADEASRPAGALYLIFVADTHLRCLYDAGMYLDMLGTALMVLMTVLMGRLNPSDIPMGYIAYVQKVHTIAAGVADDRSLMASDPDGHLFKIVGMTAALAAATYRTLAPQGLGGRLAATNSEIEALLATLPDSETTLDDKKITATMALDVAADSLARLHALGLEA